MKITLLAQEAPPVTATDNLQITRIHASLYAQNEELTVDCPDCFDTMVKIYETEKIRYHCENCDLIIRDVEVILVLY